MLLVLLVFDYTIHLNPNSTNVFMLLIFVTLKDTYASKQNLKRSYCSFLIYRTQFPDCYSTEYKCRYILGEPEMHFVHRGLIFSDLGFGWIMFLMQLISTGLAGLFHTTALTLHMERSPQ